MHSRSLFVSVCVCFRSMLLLLLLQLLLNGSGSFSFIHVVPLLTSSSIYLGPYCTPRSHPIFKRKCPEYYHNSCGCVKQTTEYSCQKLRPSVDHVLFIPIYKNKIYTTHILYNKTQYFVLCDPSRSRHYHHPFVITLF